MDSEVLLERGTIAENLTTGIEVTNEGPVLVLTLLIRDPWDRSTATYTIDPICPIEST